MAVGHKSLSNIIRDQRTRMIDLRYFFFFLSLRGILCIASRSFTSSCKYGKNADTLRKEDRLLFLAFHPARRFSSCQGQRSMLGRANARAIKRGILSASIDDNFRWPASSIRQRQSRRFPATEQDPIRFSIGDRSFFSFVAARKRVTEATFTRCLSTCQGIQANDVGHKYTSAFVEFSTSNSLIETKGFRTRWENSVRRSPLDRARHPRVREPFGYEQTFTATLSRIV